MGTDHDNRVIFGPANRLFRRQPPLDLCKYAFWRFQTSRTGRLSRARGVGTLHTLSLQSVTITACDAQVNSRVYVFDLRPE